jgi:hypothetical protein
MGSSPSREDCFEFIAQGDADESVSTNPMAIWKAPPRVRDRRWLLFALIWRISKTSPPACPRRFVKSPHREKEMPDEGLYSHA